MDKRRFIIEMGLLAKEKKRILDSIFISKEEAERIRDYTQKIKEADLLIRCIKLSNKLDNAVKLLGDIMRKHNDSVSKDTRKTLQKVFIEFYQQLDEFDEVQHQKNMHYVLTQDKSILKKE